MNCPQCGHEKTEVRDSRPYGETIRRRRRCHACAHRFSTYEILQEEYDVIAASDTNALKRVGRAAAELQRVLGELK